MHCMDNGNYDRIGFNFLPRVLLLFCGNTDGYWIVAEEARSRHASPAEYTAAMDVIVICQANLSTIMNDTDS